MTRDEWLGIRPVVVGGVVAILAFFWGKDMGSNAERPDDDACRNYIESLRAAAYAWADWGQYTIDPGGWYDDLDRTPQERAAAGAKNLREAESFENQCSLRPDPMDPYGF